MAHRLTQVLLLIFALVFLFAALDAFTEPWFSMDAAEVVETICGHLVSLGLSLICFFSALHFGVKAAYGNSRRVREPEL